VGNRVMSRQLYGGGSYLSQSQQELFFGWAEESPADVVIHWPLGKTTRIESVAPRQRLVVVEP
jgi:hypothetical protein